MQPIQVPMALRARPTFPLGPFQVTLRTVVIVFALSPLAWAALRMPAPGGTRVAVAFNVKLIKIPERKIVALKSVTRQQPAAADTIPEIVRAFDAALASAVEEAVRWAVGQPALSSARASLF